MRKNKKFLTFMVAASLCAVQFACPMSMVGVAAEQTIYTGTCGAEGDNITWTYDVSTQTMTFSGTGAMNDFSDGEEIPWMSGELSEIYDAKNIIYEEGITDVGDIISVSIFGKDGEHYDVTIPESATDLGWCVGSKLKYNITYYVKYGSLAYYDLYDYVPKQRKNCDIVGTEVAQNEVIPTEGKTEQGLIWNFDYETATLTLGGTDGGLEINLDKVPSASATVVNTSIKYGTDVKKLWNAAEAIVIEKDFIVPEDPEILKVLMETEGVYGTTCEHSYMLQIVGVLGHYDPKTIYCYKGSSFAQEYEAYADYWSDFPAIIQDGNSVVCLEDVVEDDIKIESNNAILTGDLNMDGNVNLMDAIHLNKYTAKIVDLSDTQRAAADCDGDGLVNDADVTTLMEFLILQIPSLPYTGAEA